MKTEPIFTKFGYIVVPPESETDYCIEISEIGNTEYDAWYKFAYPALNMNAYKKDGWKAVLVKVEVTEEQVAQ